MNKLIIKINEQDIKTHMTQTIVSIMLPSHNTGVHHADIDQQTTQYSLSVDQPYDKTTTKTHSPLHILIECDIPPRSLPIHLLHLARYYKQHPQVYCLPVKKQGSQCHRQGQSVFIVPATGLCTTTLMADNGQKVGVLGTFHCDLYNKICPL